MQNMRFKWPLAALCCLLLAVPALGIPIPNGVKGYPHVTCGAHSITVDVDTEREFGGRIYVKNEADKKQCVRTYGPTHSNGYSAPKPTTYAPKIGIELKFGECNMRRQRTLHPRGVEYTFTMVVSFHPLFLTKVDRAYRVRCFYMEAVKTVQASVDVSMLTTHQLNEQFPMPQCTYHLKKGYNGADAKYAKVGDKITHVWQCDKVAGYVFGMLVHSCYVDDGSGNKVQLVDGKGCAVDQHLVPQLRYDDHLITAHVDTHVFKYADKPHLFFTCTIQLCFKNDGGCKGITPPNCGYGTHEPKPAAPYEHHSGPPEEEPYRGPPPQPPKSYRPPPPPPHDDPYRRPIPPPSPREDPYGAPPLKPIHKGYGNDGPPAPHPDGDYHDEQSGPYDGPPPPYDGPPSPPHGGPPPYDGPPIPSFIPKPADFFKGRIPYQQKDQPLDKGQALLRNSTGNWTNDDHLIYYTPTTSAQSTTVPEKNGGGINKREVDNDALNRMETDVTAEALVVLPFDLDDQENGNIERPINEKLTAVLPPYERNYAVIRPGRSQSVPGICLSTAGFGIFVMLFLFLILFSSTLTVVLVRRHWNDNSFKF